MDLNYLFHRQQVERTRADAADSEEARIAHEQLARCYEAIINEATGEAFELRLGGPSEGKGPKEAQ